MTGLGIFRRSDEEREEMAARRSAAKVADHERRRKRVLVYLLEHGGVAPCLAAPITILRALLSREFVEVRFHLTPAGRREAEAAKRDLKR